MKIIVDSGCDLNEEVIGRSAVGIECVPLSLQLSDKLYIDDGPDRVDEILAVMESGGDVPRSAAPSPNLYAEKFDGDDSVFVVTLSSGMSASNDSAVIARQMYLEEIGQKFIHVFDSLSASVGETLIALKISELYKKKLSNLEIVDNMNKFIKNLKTYVLLDKFDSLVKTGRLNPYVAKIASMLSIKPICGGVDGVLTLLDKARGYNKAVIKLIEMMKAEKADFESRILGISHVKCLEKAMALRDAICEKIPFKDSIILDTSGLITVYANRGGLIVAF